MGGTKKMRCGHWVLKANKEPCNYRWNVTAHCSECGHDAGEVWSGFFPGVPDSIAETVALSHAKHELSNYCPDCGAYLYGNKEEDDEW